MQLWLPLSTIVLVNSLNDRNELFDKYGEIFPHGNRNAASHRWATYILERSEEMSEHTMRDLFAGFCPVSGSPLSYDRGVSRWNMTLPRVTGGKSTGMLYYCCWPCVCDTADFIHIDTKTVKTSDGERQYQFAVIGNPCQNPDAIPVEAPDVNCDEEKLVKATLSDHGFIIIGMYFEPGVSGHSDASVESTSQTALDQTCQERADTGHHSGMGMIFRQVAAISAITPSVHLLAPLDTPDSLALSNGGSSTALRGVNNEAGLASTDATTTIVSSENTIVSMPQGSLSAACSAAWASALLIALLGVVARRAF